MTEEINAFSTKEKFESKFEFQPQGVWSAPGRVNLIGEHTDYNNGFVLPFAINFRTFAALTPRTDGIARIASSLAGEVIETPIEEISRESTSGWVSYPLGVAWALGQSGNSITGFDLYIDSTVPVGSGLSSSAALECSVAIALNDVFGLGLDLKTLAKVGQRAENEIVGAPTGIMDQTASLNGAREHAVFIDCESLEIEKIPLNFEDENLCLLVIDTTVSHRLVDGGYAERRHSCELGAAKLGKPSLRQVSLDDLVEAERLLGNRVFRRVRHVVTENQRVLETVSKLKSAGPKSIGELLYKSHESMRDDFEISIPELDLAVEVAMAKGAIGARMTGGGFGGAAIALVSDSLVGELSESVLAAFQSKNYLKPNIFTVLADDGARREL